MGKSLIYLCSNEKNIKERGGHDVEKIAFAKFRTPQFLNYLSLRNEPSTGGSRGQTAQLPDCECFHQFERYVLRTNSP